MKSSLHTASSTSRQKLAGILHQSNKAGEHVTSRKIFTGQDIIIGRDSSRCQYTIDDPFVSHKHLRIYTTVYDEDDPTDVPPLVYAQDLSRNGTYWNGSLIGKGNGGFLLSPCDSLRLSSSTLLCFERGEVEENSSFDLTQENEMKGFRQKYTVTDRLLGAGQWGKVYMAINESQRRQLACKVVDLRKVRVCTKRKHTGKEQPAQAEDVDYRVQMRKLASLADQKKKMQPLEHNLERWYREVDILGSITHPNIVGVERAIVTDNTLYIFQDLVTAGDLISYLESKNGQLIENEAAHIVRQVVIAVKFLHERNIVHRDIKLENILITTLAVGCRVILTAFGSARRIANHRQRMTSVEWTPGYHAPEVKIDHLRSNQGYSKAVDLWSIGCVTFVLLTGDFPFREWRTNQYSDTLAGRCNLAELDHSSEWSETSFRSKAFVSKLLLLDESRHLTAGEVLQDSWFNNGFLKPDFEDLYKRTIKHWQPRLYKKPIIEFMNAREVKQLQCSQDVLAAGNRSQGRRGHSPVEPPYKPFPRQMHQSLFPPRRPSGSQHRMSQEVQAAIREHWSSASSADESSRSSKRTTTKQTPYLEPRKPAFKALRRSPLLGQTVSRTTAHASLTTSINTLTKRQPLVTTSDHPNRNNNNDNAPIGTSLLKRSRPVTPRPKPMEISRKLSSRALPIPISDPSLYLLDGHHRKNDQQAFEASHRPVSPVIPVNATNTLPAFNSSPACPRIGLDETSKPIQSLSLSKSVKPSSGLKLRTPRSAKLRSTPASGSRKRRMSIYYMEDDEEIEDSENEPKHHRPAWRTAAHAFGRSPQEWNGNAPPRDVESTLVPTTPSPAGDKSSIYLPRL